MYWISRTTTTCTSESSEKLAKRDEAVNLVHYTKIAQIMTSQLHQADIPVDKASWFDAKLHRSESDNLDFIETFYDDNITLLNLAMEYMLYYFPSNVKLPIF